MGTLWMVRGSSAKILLRKMKGIPMIALRKMM
jgi:hypothetical protein